MDLFEIKKPDDEILKKVETYYIDDLVKISLKDDPTKFCIMPRKFVAKDLERIKNMEIFEDDIWIVTFPKCGTTWTQEMIWMLNNNLDYETSSKVILDERFPFLEVSGFLTDFTADIVEICKNLPRPRYIKSHLPHFLLPDHLWTIKPKIIYVVRNPKDTAVSWYHHHLRLHEYKGTKEEFYQAFVKNLMFYLPMNEHVVDFWKIKDQSNILFLFFEDMKRNLDQEVKKAMKFLSKNYSQEEIDKLCRHLSFESIKNNKNVNKDEVLIKFMQAGGKEYDQSDGFSFIRKGQVGGFKNELTTEQNEMLDEYAKCKILKEIKFD